MSTDNDLTLIVAPAALLGVRETLRDWSAGGLVSDFVWVPAEAQNGQWPAFGISAGRKDLVQVSRLAGLRQYRTIRVVALTRAVDGEFALVTRVGDELRWLAAQEFGGTAVEALRVLYAEEAAEESVDLGSSSGWVDAIVAASDSRGPGIGAGPVDAAAPREVYPHLASQLAALAALYTGVEASALDEVPAAATGYRARLSRSFYRGVDATAVEDGLHDRLFDVSEGYPLPNESGNLSVAVENEQAAVDQASSALWRKHSWVLARNRVAPQVPAQEKITAGAALKYFFQFLFAALRGAPANWAKALLRSGKAAVAQTVQRAVFGGGDSAYSVVVDGIDANGNPAHWQDAVQAAENLEQRLTGNGQTQHRDLSELWRGYTNTTFTMLDAQTRGQDLQPLYAGTRTAVVRGPSALAGDPAQPFRLQGATAGLLGARTVQPADILQANELGNQIQQLALGSGVSSDAAGQFSDMTEWFNTNRASFTNRVGEPLATALDEVKAEVAERLRSFRRPASDDDGGAWELGETNRIARVKMRILTGVMTSVALLFGLLSFIGVFAWWLFAILFALSVLGWLGGALIQFLNTRRALFAIMHRNSQADAQAEADRQNLAAALGDLSRLGDAYGQYLRWADLVGAFVHRPFGPARPRTAKVEGGFDDLPLNAGVASFVVDRPAVESAVATLRAEMFPVGWLDAQWRTFLGRTVERAGLGDPVLAEDAGRLFHETSYSEVSSLGRVAQCALTEDTDPVLSAGWWANAGQRLANPRLDQVRSTLLRTVSLSGNLGRQPTEDFIGAVGTPTGSDYSRPEMLDDSVLTDAGASADLHRLAEDGEFMRSVVTGLGRVVVHTQLSQPLGPDDLRFAQHVEDMPEWAADSAWALNPLGDPGSHVGDYPEVAQGRPAAPPVNPAAAPDAPAEPPAAPPVGPPNDPPAAPPAGPRAPGGGEYDNPFGDMPF